MTDAIGLSERLRERIRLLGQSPDSILKFMDRILPLIEEAATQLDALQERVKELEAERDEARKAACLGCDARNGGPHSVMAEGSYKFCTGCGETIRTPTLRERARVAESRATRAEQDRVSEWNLRRETESQRDAARAAADTLRQERDEAYERAAKVAEEQAVEFLSPQYASEQPFGSICERFACEEVAKAIRRLAGPEEIAAANDGEERR